MYRFYINNIDNEYHYSELIRTFFDNDEFEVIPLNVSNEFAKKLCLRDKSFFIDSKEHNTLYRRDALKRVIYSLLSDLTGATKPWGTVTGVHPLKLAYKLRARDYRKTAYDLKQRYLINDDKSNLLIEIMKYQDECIIGTDTAIPYDDSKLVGLYIGIPFCPSICDYCSFSSVIAGIREVRTYLSYLIREIEYVGKMAVEHGYKIESVYIGGGTPTILEADDLNLLIDSIIKSFDIDISNTEITVEAGRPDTITKEKLTLIKGFNIGRISINPQTLNQKTLYNIGRNHTVFDVYRAFKEAKDQDIKIINSDIIAGLPGESTEDFKDTLDRIIDLDVENVTVHTLSIKKGSRFEDKEPDTFRYGEESVEGMLKYSHEVLKKSGYRPYYIYKQKNQIGGMENTGWCKPYTHSVYNVRMIEENQSIIALGAGGIGKKYYPDGNESGIKIKRIANPRNVEIYMKNFNEILEKKKLYFQ